MNMKLGWTTYYPISFYHTLFSLFADLLSQIFVYSFLLPPDMQMLDFQVRKIRKELHLKFSKQLLERKISKHREFASKQHNRSTQNDQIPIFKLIEGFTLFNYYLISHYFNRTHHWFDNNNNNLFTLNTFFHVEPKMSYNS